MLMPEDLLCTDEGLDLINKKTVLSGPERDQFKILLGKGPRYHDDPPQRSKKLEGRRSTLK